MPSSDRAELVAFSPVSPTVLRVERYRFFFFSNEGHEPPHVRVRDGEKPAKRWLDPVLLAASTGFAPRELTRVQTLVAEQRDALWEARHEFFRS